MTERIIKYQKIEERKICDKKGGGGGKEEEEEKKKERNISMSKELMINDQRLTRCYHPLSLHTLFSGKDNLSAVDNDILFIEVQNYIKNTGRFR